MRSGWRPSGAALSSLSGNIDTSQELRARIQGATAPRKEDVLAVGQGREERDSGMDSKEKQKRYEEYIAEGSLMAAAIGRRVPYHLEYLRRHRDITPVPAAAKDGEKG